MSEERKQIKIRTVLTVDGAVKKTDIITIDASTIDRKALDQLVVKHYTADIYKYQNVEGKKCKIDYMIADD